MTIWPNWVDLVILTIVFRACYNGFGRGVLTEFLSLIGAVSVTAVTLNYFNPVRTALQPLLGWIPPHIAAVLLFWGFFLLLLLACHAFMRRLTDVVKWERIHWVFQGIGLFLGGVRGLWWAGLIVVALSSSGLVSLRDSVEQQSLVGPGLLAVSRPALERVADRFPGAEGRLATLVPPLWHTPE